MGWNGMEWNGTRDDALLCSALLPSPVFVTRRKGERNEGGNVANCVTFAFIPTSIQCPPCYKFYFEGESERAANELRFGL